MKISNFNQGMFSAGLMLLLLSSGSHAEIYKWVDANGRTHYSERKEAAGTANAVELKVKSEPTSGQAAQSSPQYWQEQEIQFRQRQAEKPNEKPNGPAVVKRPKSLSGGRSDETDTGRCKLAKDILSGAVRHRNGAPTDKYDREVAENDVRAYCH